MHASSKRYFINPVFEDDVHKTTPVESLQLQKQTTNLTKEETGHSNDTFWNQHGALNSGKANPAQGSNRGLLALVIIVCLISLAALLLTLLMLSGKIGSANEVPYSASAKSLQKDPADIKALEENITNLRLDLLKNLDSALTQLKFALNRTNADHAEGLNSTQTKLDNLDSVLNQLKSVLNRTNNDLEELNSTQTKGPNPSANIVASYNNDASYSTGTVIKDWSTSDPHSHLEGGMTYNDGNLTVPIAGRYYIYAQFAFRSAGRVEIRVKDDYVSLITSPESQGGVSNGIGVFVLNAGDTVSLRISPWGAPDDGSVEFWMEYHHCYFGAFFI